MNRKIDSIRLSASIVIIFAIVYFYLNLFSPSRIPRFLRVGTLRKPITLLILGTDITYDAVSRKPIPGLEGRTDSILLAHVDPIRYKIKILSIPRDTYANIPGYGHQKINAAHAYGGINLTKQTISDLTNTKIDYYLEFNPSFIKKLVDLLGGVSLYVEKDMSYVDHAQNLNINLKQGWQKLSGKQAHGYIRFRYDAEGDWGRMRRQQQFLKALSQALVKPTNIAKLPFTIFSVLKEVKTDLPLPYAIRLANSVRMLTAKDIKTDTSTGEETSLPGAGSVIIPNQDILRSKVKDLF